MVSEDAARALSAARIKFTEVCRDETMVEMPKGDSGERI
jgi:hypothetical protein